MSVSSFSSAAKPGVCLSTDRPDSPFDGQVIYETDTNRTLVYDNSAWVVIHDPSLMSYSGTGVTVTADAATVGGENVTPYTGRRNLLYNGAMQVWQRATSGTTTGTDNYKTMDRWRNRVGSGGQSATYSRQSAGLTGFQYCARIQRPSGGTDTGRINLIQSLETVDVIPMAGRTVTLSFYARKGANFSGASDNMLAYLITGSGTDVYWGTLASTGSPIINGTTSTLTSSWQRFTITASAPSNAESLFLDLSYDPTGTAGADDYFEVTGVQLELGDKATPFEHRSFGEELALCQRYFWRNIDPAGFGVNGNSNATRVLIPFHTEMRAIPSMSGSGTYNFWNGVTTATTSTLRTNYSTTSAGQLDFTGGLAGSNGDPCALYTNGGSQYIDFSAEL